MAQKTLSRRTSDLLLWSLDRFGDYLPVKLQDWVRKTQRQFYREDDQYNTLARVREELNKNKKYIRWGCAACGAFIEEIHKWPKKGGTFTQKKCRNGHTNFLSIKREGELDFSALAVKAEDVLREPKEMVK